MQKIKKFLNDNKFYIIAFVFMFIICSLAPLNGDDWGNYNSNTTIKWSFENAIKGYFTYESRIISRFLINLLCYNKFTWSILNSLAFCSIYWSLTKIFEAKTSNEYKSYFLILIMIPCAMFGQVYSWMTGSITYLFPVALILTYFTYALKIVKKYNVLNVSMMFIANLIGGLFIDHCGIALVGINIILIISNLRQKKKTTWIYLCCLVLSIISVSIAFFAPGNISRLSTTTEFAQLSILQKVFSNYTNFIDYIYAVNPVLAILMLIPINYMINNTIKKNIILKIIVLLFLNIIPIYSLLYHYDLYNPLIKYIASLDFYWKSTTILTHKIVYIYWTTISILFIVSIFYNVKNKDKIIIYISILIISLLPNCAMLLSPTWGFRTTYFTNILLSSITISLIFEIINKVKYTGKDFKILLNTLYYFFIMYLIIIFSIIFHFNNVRYSKISEQYNSGERNIIVKACPIRYIWNYNPFMEFHNNTYKSYLKDKKIINNTDITITMTCLDTPKDVIKGW